MSFSVNDSPYAGRDGDKVQSRVIRERLEREAEGNVAIRVTMAADNDSFAKIRTHARLEPWRFGRGWA